MSRRTWLVLAVCLSLGACSDPASPSGNGGGTVVLVGAGDIGWCGEPGAEQTARLLDGIPGTVFTTGDNAYPAGTASDFQNCYEPFWGRHKARTRPSAGNHDYSTPGAEAYFDYFGDRAGPRDLGYYNYLLGSWHIVVLNSNLPMAAGTPQEQWLRGVLQSSSAMCTLAYWHEPLFSSGLHGNDPLSLDSWRALREAGAEIVVNGHDHVYERFAPQSPDGVADPQGLRQFTVGTGGAPRYDFPLVRPNSEFRYNASVGVLRLSLASSSYSWTFIVPPNTVRDTGAGTCR